MLLLWLAADLMDELLRTDGIPIADGMAECRLLNLARILAANSAIPAFAEENKQLFLLSVFAGAAIQLIEWQVLKYLSRGFW